MARRIFGSYAVENTQLTIVTAISVLTPPRVYLRVGAVDFDNELNYIEHAADGPTSHSVEIVRALPLNHLTTDSVVG